jgi:predicted acylesterase/phospholipase RssA
MSDCDKTDSGFCRILSLDGGGVRGALTARMLRNMERYLNDKDGKDRPLGQRFDLIAGTSVGGILALSLAMGKRAEEIVEYWVDGKEAETGQTPSQTPPSPNEQSAGHGRTTQRLGGESEQSREDGDKKGGKIQQIFGHPQPLGRWLFRMAKHDSKALKEALTEWFGEKKLNELGQSPNAPHVLVTSTALAKPSLRTWKSPRRPEYAARADQKLSDVAYASAAAPTFFHAQTDAAFDSPNADGGLCANNPAVVAIIEALGMGFGLDQIRLVSVGTGIPCAMPYDPNKIGAGGALRWLFKWKPKAIPLIELMMEAQSDMVHQQAKFLLKDRGLYLRIDRQLKFPMTLDELGKINLLAAYADLTADDHQALETIFP